MGGFTLLGYYQRWRYQGVLYWLTELNDNLLVCRKDAEEIMPLYEYECPEHGKFEELRPVDARTIPALCPKCGQMSERIMSAFRWVMGWDFLKNVKSEPAPTDAGYHPKWDD